RKIQKQRTRRITLRSLGLCIVCKQEAVTGQYCAEHNEQTLARDWRNRGIFGPRREDIIARRNNAVMARLREELGRDAFEAHKEYILAHFDIFCDPQIDSALFTSVELKEEFWTTDPLPAKPVGFFQPAS